MTRPPVARAAWERGASASGPGRSCLPLLLLPTLLLAVAGYCSTVLTVGLAVPWLTPLLLLLLPVSYSRMALTAVSPLLGLVPRRPARHAASAQTARIRTAILLPVFNEPSAPIVAALRTMSDSLDPSDDVAFFVLSDTQDPVLARQEALVFPASSLSRSGVPISYRRRTPNTGRKAGNIAEFCETHGADYEFAIVLDADSLMTADAIRSLIAALRDDPDAALVQSVSYPIGGTTLFARLQQFGARLNTPLSVAGQDLWQHRRGTYWGHNAILRLQPFIDHATLPVLPGRPPLGGEILCHDTIEAALLLRGGWDVRLAPEIGGSYETTPSNLVDYLARERRWCQGNLQHMRLLREPGFPAASRVHIGMGILYYLATPIGLLVSLLLLLGGLLVHGATRSAPSRLAVDACLWLTLFMLLAPRLANLVRALLLPGLAQREFGGRTRLLLSALVEQLVGMLLAPIIAVSVTEFVIDTFRGTVVGWNTAARGDRPVGWAEAAHRFGAHTLIGASMIAAICLVRPALLPWSLPFLSGLVLAIPLARGLGSIRLGTLARRLGLFLTIDELTPITGMPTPVEPCTATDAAIVRPRPRSLQDDMTAASGD